MMRLDGSTRPNIRSIRRPSASTCVRQAQFGQHGHAGRLQHQARAERPRLFEALEDRDAMTVTLQQQGGCETGRTCARNRYRPWRHAGSDFFSPLGWAMCSTDPMEP